jgi:AraC-like DNA-binding protein
MVKPVFQEAWSPSLVYIQQVLHWEICLEHPPEVLAIGLGRHDEPAHSYKLNGLWCLHLYRYNGELVLGEERTPIRPGTVSLIPPNTLFEHVWPERPAEHVSVHFRLKQGAAAQVPLIQSVGVLAERMWEDLTEAVSWLEANDARLAARIWDVLWQVAGRESPVLPQQATSQTLDLAMRLIASRIDCPISIGALAGEVGVSHNHLIRLFQKHHGQTVQEYVRTLRARRAHHLLVNTTMPVKVVATLCGISDLHSFNKTIRKVYGKCPSLIRSEVGSDFGYRDRDGNRQFRESE